MKDELNIIHDLINDKWLQDTVGNEDKGYCIFGAALHAFEVDLKDKKSLNYKQMRECMDLLHKLAKVSGYRCAISMNDANGQTKENMLALVQTAIERNTE
jgi:hypothetical protein